MGKMLEEVLLILVDREDPGEDVEINREDEDEVLGKTLENVEAIADELDREEDAFVEEVDMNRLGLVELREMLNELAEMKKDEMLDKTLEEVEAIEDELVHEDTFDEVVDVNKLGLLELRELLDELAAVGKDEPLELLPDGEFDEQVVPVFMVCDEELKVLLGEAGKFEDIKVPDIDIVEEEDNEKDERRQSASCSVNTLKDIILMDSQCTRGVSIVFR